MIDVWSVIGGVIGGSLLFLASGVGQWLKKNHAQRKQQKRWLAQQERLRERRGETNRNI